MATEDVLNTMESDQYMFSNKSVKRMEHLVR